MKTTKLAVHPDLTKNLPEQMFEKIEHMLQDFDADKYFATREYWNSNDGHDNQYAIRQLVRIQNALGMNKKADRRDPKDMLNYKGDRLPIRVETNVATFKTTEE